MELLIAMAIGIALVFGSLNLLLHSKRSYLESEERARMLENGRRALRYLSYELGMAGHLGHLFPGTEVESVPVGTGCFNHMMLSATPVEHVNDVAASGVAGVAGWSLPDDCLLPGKHVPGSDVLLIRRTASRAVVLGGQRFGDIEPESIYLEQAGDFEPPVIDRGVSVGTSGDLWEYLPKVLFLRNYSSYRGDGIPTLCRKRPGRSSNNMAPTECLIEGVEQLQLDYGIDTNGDNVADQYEPAPTPDELRLAKVVRINLLMRSISPLAGYQDDRWYQLGRKRVEAVGDGYYRRLMQSTVVLRNTGGFWR